MSFYADGGSYKFCGKRTSRFSSVHARVHATRGTPNQARGSGTTDLRRWPTERALITAIRWRRIVPEIPSGRKTRAHARVSDAWRVCMYVRGVPTTESGDCDVIKSSTITLNYHRQLIVNHTGRLLILGRSAQVRLSFQLTGVHPSYNRHSVMPQSIISIYKTILP